jgi:L-threonylcarbamoyladenylate synthase
MGGAAEKPNAPGQLASHYAPSAAVRLEAEDVRSGEVRLGFGPGACDLNLSATGDLVEAAANLFHSLREADLLAAGRGIAVAPVPEVGLGRAINDRLRRAAAPRG